MKVVVSVGLVALLAGGVLVARGIGSRQSAPEAAALPTLQVPAGGIRILAAHAFVLDEPYVHEWRAEKPLADAGWLLALEVDPELGRTRETYEPVLYVGAETAERCSGGGSGRMVVVVPAPLDAAGRPALDLDSAPIWFGSLELPERVDAARVEQELALARRAGVGPAAFAAGARESAAAQDPIRARTRWELQPYVDDLLARFSVR